MAQIDVVNLTFSYDTSYENIFQDVSFQIDTDWKLGLIGRNGRGKTTFLNLLLGKYKYQGTISSPTGYTYFPFDVENEEDKTIEILKQEIGPYKKLELEMQECLEKSTTEDMIKYSDLLDQYNEMDGYIIDELIEKEISKLDINPDVLQREYKTLSNGERTKVQLAALFLKKNNFLLIDEPTNHLDMEGREVVSNYLGSKKGFILVSHDRDFLDHIIDHVLTINRKNIDIQKGNYSTWQLNKDREDQFEINTNAKLKKEITKLTKASKRLENWSDKVEKSKIGTHSADRGAVGAQAARVMKRSKTAERHANDKLDAKKDLLKNIEKIDDLKIRVLDFHKDVYVEAIHFSAGYDEMLFSNIDFKVAKGDRFSVRGKNGSGKSTLIKTILGLDEDIKKSGELMIPKGLKISYVSQDSSYLKGYLNAFAEEQAIDESLFKAILRKLGFQRISFEKNMEEFSAGQRKKVLIAKSLSEEANLYVWDEPLNYVDIISRIQIEELIGYFKPTIIFIEHDKSFHKNISNNGIIL